MPVDAGTIYSEVRIALDKLKQDIAKVEANLDKFGKKNAKHSTDVENNWTKSFKAMSLAGVAAAAAITIAIKKAVTTFATFEQALANVRSVAQATPKEFKEIEKAAIEAGETTRFTATQSAEAMYSLASAGYTAQQSMEALNGVLLLAGATQSDLAMTARTVTSAIAQFNLEAADAEQVANIFAAAINNSKATMEKLSVSMRYVGPVASSMNKSLEETTGLLQILYDNGFVASQAGTALRGVLADLSNEMSPAVKRLKQLGVAYDQVNPRTNSYADILEVLSENQEVANRAMEIFGDRAGPAMIKLIQGGREEIEKYTEAVTGTNAAAEAYAIQNDTLQGNLDFLKSAVESLQIKFVQEFAPAIRAVVDILTGFIKVIASAPGPIKIMLGILAGAIPIILGISGAIKLLGLSVTFSVPHVTALVAGIGLLIGVVAGLAGAIGNAVQEAEDLKDALDVVKGVSEGTVASVNDMKDAQTTLREEVQRLQKDFLKAKSAGWDVLADDISERQESLITQINELSSAIREIEQAEKDAAEELTKAEKKRLKQLKKREKAELERLKNIKAAEEEAERIEKERLAAIKEEEKATELVNKKRQK